MRIFGTEVEEKYLVAFAAGSIFGGGFFYVAYKLLTRKRNVGRTFGKISNNNVDCEADLMLPVTLEKEYGNGRKVCISSDETASAFLKHLPEHFFQFQEKFAQLISSTLTDKKCTRALIIGSKTGALAFNLSKIFTQVKGIERSFSQVVTCYRFQNLDNFVYHFPLEGSLKTSNRTVVSPLLEQIASQTAAAFKKNKKKEHERIEFINWDPSELPGHIGDFELVIVNNCLNDIDDPEKFLRSLERFVEYNGTLVISSDYNWKRATNQETGFGGLPVTNSIELLLHFLKDHFTFIEDKYIPEAFCVSNRTCHVSNNHVTVWSRNFDKKEMP